MEETEEKRREMEDAERRARHIEAMREEREKWEMRLIKIGWRMMGGFSVTPFGSTSEWFDMAYTKYEEMEKANWETSGIFAFGFWLSLRLSDAMVFATELNYNLFASNYYYGDDRSFMQTTVYSNTVSVPVLLRLFIPGEIGENKIKRDYYFEVGYQFGFPFYSSADIKSGDSFIYGEINDNKNFSEYRLKMDQAIVAGFGLRLDGGDFSTGFRFIYNWTKLDKYGSLNAPIALGITLAYEFF